MIEKYTTKLLYLKQCAVSLATKTSAKKAQRQTGPETDRPRDRPAQAGTGPGTDNVQGQNVKILKPEVENMDYHYNLGIAKAFENNHQMHKL